MIEISGARVIDAEAIVVIIGGTLICAGGLTLWQAPSVRSSLVALAQKVPVKEFGRGLLKGAAGQMGRSLNEWGSGPATTRPVMH